jgi:hypothetical protein
MKEKQFVECRNCGTIHYVVNKIEADTLKNRLIEGFSSRNLSYCSNCGSKGPFSNISEFYMNYFSPSDKIPPILLE